MPGRAIRLLLLTLFLPACTATPMPLPGSPDVDRMSSDLGGHHATPDGGPSVTLDDRGILPPGGDAVSVGGADALTNDLPDGGPSDGGSDGSDGSDGGDGGPQQELGAPDALGPPLDALAPHDAVVPSGD